jgi:hypothetical protein
MEGEFLRDLIEDLILVKGIAQVIIKKTAKEKCL